MPADPTAASLGGRTRGTAVAVVGASHPGPALAVTVLAGLLAVAADLDPVRGVLVVVAVASGQLTIGWTNDLLDVARDRAVGRTDKPLAAPGSGAALVRRVRVACVVALLVCVPASLACGVVAGLLHLLVVASGWAYNLGLKATWWSWAPYAVAFGALPVFVHRAGHATTWPVWWWPVCGALIGVGAHLVNVLPDLDDDAATGVRGLPHRLGAGRTTAAAVVVLVAATACVVLGARGLDPGLRAVAVAVVACALVAAVVGRGRTPFRAAVVVALVDVVLLVTGGR